MKWEEEERKKTSHNFEEKHLASGGGSLSVCLTLTDWVVTAPIRARVEWIWLDNASGAADDDEADTTDIDFDSSPLVWVVGLGEGEDCRMF